MWVDVKWEDIRPGDLLFEGVVEHIGNRYMYVDDDLEPMRWCRYRHNDPTMGENWYSRWEPSPLLDAVGEYLKSYQDHVSLKEWMKARDRLFVIYQRALKDDE
jgi:hypothetical protein